MLCNLRAVCELHLGRSASSDDEEETSKLDAGNNYLRKLLQVDVDSVDSNERKEVEAMFDKVLEGRN